MPWAELGGTALWLCGWIFKLTVLVAALLTWGLVVRWLGAVTHLADLQVKALENALKQRKTKPPG